MSSGAVKTCPACWARATEGSANRTATINNLEIRRWVSLIPIIAQRHWVIAMDFIGFGRSDKFSDPVEYTFEMHRGTIASFIEALDLQGITAVVQDWGGILGLRAVSQMPDRFARLVIMNTG